MPFSYVVAAGIVPISRHSGVERAGDANYFRARQYAAEEEDESGVSLQECYACGAASVGEGVDANEVLFNQEREEGLTDRRGGDDFSEYELEAERIRSQDSALLPVSAFANVPFTMNPKFLVYSRYLEVCQDHGCDQFCSFPVCLAALFSGQRWQGFLSGSHTESRGILFRPFARDCGP